ncbi:MAG: metallophosphoesterase [Pseudomonadales bacterium]
MVIKVLKSILYLFLVLIAAVLLIAGTAWTLTFKHDIHESHSTPYLRDDVISIDAPQSAPVWEVLLMGDAGDATLVPWHKTLEMAAEMAAQKPDQTSVVMLGDNIYFFGYPNLDEGQTEYDQDQLELIDRLDAQLQVSKHSRAELFLVPGNHDWYAEQVDTQAEHVLSYAQRHGASVSFLPWVKGGQPLPEVIHRAGISIIFIDTQWLITADQAGFDQAMHRLEQLLARTHAEHPNNLILATGHHPIQTMGPHAQYYTSRGYAFFMELVGLFTESDQDTHNPPYRRLIAGLNEAFTVDAKVVYAAGHEHSLQVFEALSAAPPAKESSSRGTLKIGADYQLVSGAAHRNKVSGVGHNDNTLFAVATEGLMKLSIYSEGTTVEVISSDGKLLHRQWLR